MPKLIRSFRGKEKARAWIDSNKKKYPGKVLGGAVYSISGSIYHAYIYGDITPEMVEEIRPKRKVQIFEYKQ